MRNTPKCEVQSIWAHLNHSFNQSVYEVKTCSHLLFAVGKETIRKAAKLLAASLPLVTNLFAA